VQAALERRAKLRSSPGGPLSVVAA
jgi:hypothetical protein